MDKMDFEKIGVQDKLPAQIVWRKDKIVLNRHKNRMENKLWLITA